MLGVELVTNSNEKTPAKAETTELFEKLKGAVAHSPSLSMPMCGTEAGDQRGVNESRSKFFPKFKPSAYIPKITRALKRSGQSLE